MVDRLAKLFERTSRRYQSRSRARSSVSEREVTSDVGYETAGGDARAGIGRLLVFVLWLTGFALPSLSRAGESERDSASSVTGQTPGRSFEWVGASAATNAELQKALESQVVEMMSGMSPAAKRGYDFLVSKPYLPSDFDGDVLSALQEIEPVDQFDDISVTANSEWATWLRYGLSPRPDDETLPLQYVRRDDGQFVMNCFACHGGNLYGTTYPGAANTLYGLEMLTEDVRKTKIEQKKPLTHMDIGSMFMPLGSTTGHSNAVMFGVALMNYRDADLNVHAFRPPARMVHHDMDAPSWWQFSRKHHIYIDGFAEKGHRGLMQFMLVRENGPDQFKQWASDFKDVYAFISEIRPPKYPFDLKSDLQSKGQNLFHENCAECHGTYGVTSDYPESMVPLADVGTDAVRWNALTPTHRANYGRSWFADKGDQNTLESPDGYVAPPLDGVWSSAPYFHNGSVPTLWDVLRPGNRPSVWRRTSLGIDRNKNGLMVERLESMPSGLTRKQARYYFDTGELGKSAEGHDFAEHLTDDECRQLLEYLKSL